MTGTAEALQDSRIDHARATIRRLEKMVIGGRWRAAAGGASIESVDPATEQVLGAVPAGDARDVDAAVTAARDAFDGGPWPALSASARGAAIARLADLVEANLEELRCLETLDNGAPLEITGGSIAYGVETLRFYAGLTTKIEGRTFDISGQYGTFHTYSRLEPMGVVGLITPWNGPLATVCVKVGPALAAGCTVVLKPSELTPYTALRFAELAEEAGIPPGVINVVTGYGHEAGEAIARHPGIAKISFTGSTRVGRSLLEASAGNFKRLTLELGGKSPLIVLDDTDPEFAIRTAAMAIFRNSGQMCFAGSRLYVQRGLYDTVVDGVARFGDALAIGNGFAPGTQLGPLISARQRERVLGYVDAGRKDGGTVVTGGEAVPGTGFFVRPTVFTDLPATSVAAREEIFGPVVTVRPFTDLDDVVALANDTEFGLASGILTNDLSRAHRLAARLRSGTVWINCYALRNPALPAGGYGVSGIGREGGIGTIRNFTEEKVVCTALL